MFGWIAFALAVLCLVPMYVLSHKRRDRLGEYVTVLLCSESFYREQQNKFAEFVKEQGASSAMQLSGNAAFAVESMANYFSQHTTLAAHTTLWTYRKKLRGEKEEPEPEQPKAKAASTVM
jgi:uridine phosphorylase